MLKQRLNGAKDEMGEQRHFSAFGLSYVVFVSSVWKSFLLQVPDITLCGCLGSKHQLINWLTKHWHLSNTRVRAPCCRPGGTEGLHVVSARWGGARRNAPVLQGRHVSHQPGGLPSGQLRRQRYCNMLFYFLLHSPFNFPLGWIKYIVIVTYCALRV